MFPFLDRLQAASRVLIAGIGGGFDVYAGIPLAVHLRRRGVAVHFANLSFAHLQDSGAEPLDPVTWVVSENLRDLPYFPERWLAEWLARQGWAEPVYGLAKTGVRPLQAAYEGLLARLDPDLVILVDGGTDALIFGDEPGLGTVVEDVVSLLAAVGAAGERCLLACIGFGVDHFHGISHHAFLENAAQIVRAGGYLGSFGLASGTPETEAFLDLVAYANQRQPRHQSIVANSIASALRGEFGNHQATARTAGSELFINPLMAQYWTFQASAVVEEMGFADALARTDTFGQASRVIEGHHDGVPLRPRRPLPL